MVSTESSREIHGLLGLIRVGDRFPVRVIGAINLTKNSFYRQSVRTTDDEILLTAKRMKQEGADILDLGARSTAPYRRYDIPEETEAKLLRRAVKLIHTEMDVAISADTARYYPAKAAIEEGAAVLNDVYGFTERDAAKIARLVSRTEVSLVLSAHAPITSKPLQTSPVEKVRSCLRAAIRMAHDNSIEISKISIDPAIGFFVYPNISNIVWNCTIIAKLEQLRDLRRPICVGISRKKFIGQLLNNAPTENRLTGSISAAAIAIYNGAHIVRAHDVKETAEAVQVATAIREKKFNRGTESR